MVKQLPTNAQNAAPQDGVNLFSGNMKKYLLNTLIVDSNTQEVPCTNTLVYIDTSFDIFPSARIDKKYTYYTFALKALDIIRFDK